MTYENEVAGFHKAINLISLIELFYTILYRFYTDFVIWKINQITKEVTELFFFLFRPPKSFIQLQRLSSTCIGEIEFYLFVLKIELSK